MMLWKTIESLNFSWMMIYGGMLTMHAGERSRIDKFRHDLTGTRGSNKSRHVYGMRRENQIYSKLSYPMMIAVVIMLDSMKLLKVTTKLRIATTKQLKATPN